MNTNEKGSDWKACNRQKRFGSSNLPHSAKKRILSDDFREDDKSIIRSKKSLRVAKKPQNKRKR